MVFALDLEPDFYTFLHISKHFYKGTRMPLSGIAWLEGWTSVAPMPGMWRARAPATQPAAPAAHHGIGPRPWSRALDWQLRGRGSQVSHGNKMQQAKNKQTTQCHHDAITMPCAVRPSRVIRGETTQDPKPLNSFILC